MCGLRSIDVEGIATLTGLRECTLRKWRGVCWMCVQCRFNHPTPPPLRQHTACSRCVYADTATGFAGDGILYARAQAARSS